MFANISWPQLLIILVIVLAIFGTKRLRNMGGDLGAAVKGFRKGMEETRDEPEEKLEPDQIASDAPAEKTSSETEKSKESSS